MSVTVEKCSAREYLKYARLREQATELSVDFFLAHRSATTHWSSALKLLFLPGVAQGNGPARRSYYPEFSRSGDLAITPKLSVK